MGFYGNITNTARTQFQFDKVYPNRYEMEQKTKTDGIYAGRYILIEYDSDVHLDHMLRVWHKVDGWYTQDSNNVNILLKEGNVTVGELVYTASAEIDRNDPRAYKNCVFYKCVGFNNDANKTAKFEEVVDGSSDPNTPAYTVNYNMDTDVFGAGRGYDSTVWQKTYSAEAGEKYVMIAELNTVVPTFDVTPDAPTMNPVVPHFDTQSTDVYYKLHWQAPWGFRVKKTEANKSDETTTHTITTYDPETGKNTTSTTNNIPAAIYYNDAGFAAQVDVSRTSAEGINKHSTTVIEDEIKVEPTGKSGNKYNDHDGQFTQSEQFDIQEMTINLPSIGNMMSDAWDIIHGPLRNDARTDENGSLQGRLDSFTDMNVNAIPVKRATDGTLVGSYINGNTNKTVTNILDEDLTESFDSDDAWIKTNINSIGLDNETDLSGIAIHHTFHPKANTITTVDKNTGNYELGNGYDATAIPVHHAQEENDIVAFYVPYVDKAGHVVGYNIERVTLPYSYRFFKTNAVTGIDDTDLYTTINPDANGDNTSEVNAVVSDLTADQTQDTFTINPGNKWVQLKLDDDSDTLTIAHEIHAVDEVAQTSNLNTDEVESESVSDKLTIQDIEFDAAGHVIMNRPHTYTLPYGFKTIAVTSESAETDGVAAAAGSVVAENTQDTLTLSPGNKWIHLTSDVNSDTITVSHEVNSITTTEVADTDLTTNTSASVTIPDWTYDEGGHIRSKQNHLYKLPFGYAQIKGDNNTSTAATATYDELSIVTGDDWLTSSVSADTVTITHDFKAVTDTTSTVDKNTVAEDKDTIKLYTPIVDNKGHVVGKNLETVTLPFGYKTFTGDNGTTSADNTQDSMSVTGDSWVQTTVSDDKIAFAHIGPVSGTATEVSAETPAFGATFSIDDHYFDDKGHKFTSKSHTVKIPLPSLTNGTGNVVTGLSLVPTTGALTETKANLGTIKLGTYDGGDSSDNLTADITLQQALSRLQNKITNEATNRQTAIEALDVTDTAVEGQYVSAVSEVDGKIQVSRANLPVYATTEQGAKADSALQLNTPIVYNDITKTVEELLKMVIDLQAQVTALEAKVNENHPVENTETIE